jgi:hypothetical protein
LKDLSVTVIAPGRSTRPAHDSTDSGTPLAYFE